MMKNFSVLTILGLVLCCVSLWVSGCSTTQPGETAAEGQRRHFRNGRINQEMLMQDIDHVMLADQPSKLNEMRVKTRIE